MAERETNDERFEREALCWLPDVTRFALSLTRDESAAEDLVQDTFLLAHAKWDQFTSGSEGRAWLFTICRNRFRRTEERERRQVPVDAPELEALAAAAIHESARAAGLERSFESAEVMAAIEGAIAALPEAFRDAALLVDLHGQSYESAAQILGVPIGTVRSRLFRARRLLQEQLLAHAQDAGIGVRGSLIEDTP